jgi:hypothetical protein
MIRIEYQHPQNLTKARIDALTTQILTTALTTLPSKAPTLPTDLHACIDIVAAQLSGQIPDADRDILAGDVASFLDNADIIASALSTYFTATTTPLRHLTSPLTPPATGDLCARATALCETATRTLPADLSSARLALALSATTLLSTHRACLEHGIRTLEQTQHGVLARHTRSRADEMHARATLLGLQARLHSLARPPPAEFVRALKAFRKGQGVGERGLRDREALARRELSLYGREAGLRELARRKVELVRAIERAEGEGRRVGRR